MVKKRSLTKSGIKKGIKKQVYNKRKSLRQHQKGGISGENCNRDYSPKVTIDELKEFYDNKTEVKKTLGCLIKYPEGIGRRKRRTLNIEKIKGSLPNFNYLVITYYDSSKNRMELDIGSASNISYDKDTGKIFLVLRDGGLVKDSRKAFAFAVSEKPEKGVEPTPIINSWIEIFKNIKNKQMSIFDIEDVEIEKLKEKEEAEKQKSESLEYQEKRDELVGYELPEIKEKVSKSYQQIKHLSDDELKELTLELRKDWAKTEFKESTRRDGKVQRVKIGSKNKADEIQKQRCRQAVREYVNEKYSKEGKPLREALVYYSCANERSSILEERFLKGEDLKQSKIRSDQKLKDDDETEIKLRKERLASGLEETYYKKDFHRELDNDKRIEDYLEQRRDSYKELEELTPSMRIITKKIPYKLFNKLKTNRSLEENKINLLKYVSEEEYETLKRYGYLNKSIINPLTDEIKQKTDERLSKMTLYDSEDADAMEEEFKKQDDIFSSGRTELGGGRKSNKKTTKRNKKNHKKKSHNKKTKKTKKHNKKSHNKKSHNKKSHNKKSDNKKTKKITKHNKKNDNKKT